MSDKSNLFLHGFASSSRGEKARFLKDKFTELEGTPFFALDFNPTPVDFEHMTITGMINRLRQFCFDHELEKVNLIGSSMGALVALQYAALYPVERLLLVAPLLYYQSLSMSDQVLSWWEKRGTIDIDHYAFPGQLPLRYDFHVDGQRYDEISAPAAHILIIHGWRDEQVPIEDSRFFVEKYSDWVELREVKSDHRLGDQLEFIWENVESFLLGNQMGDKA
jgi:pimeloyl-ACP methyl ester carboxylesterase